MTKQKIEKARQPIWYFVGWILFIIGLLVVIGGVLSLFSLLPVTSVIAETHPNLWWGGFITLFGGFYVWKYHGVRVD